MEKDIKCIHYDGDGYVYKVNDEQTILLCAQCHMNLAAAIVKQVVIEALVPGVIGDVEE